MIDESLRVRCYEQARANYRSGESARALELLDLLLLHDPDDGLSWELTGIIRREQQEYESGLAALETASLLRPLSPAGRCAVADCDSHCGHAELAVEIYVSLVKWSDASSDDLFAAADGLDRHNRAGLAVVACRTVARRDPDHAEAFYRLGYYMGRSGYPPHLVEGMARRAIRLDPQRASYRVGLSAMLEQAGRIDDAYAVVKSLSEEQLAQVSCRCCLERILRIYESAGDWERAGVCRARVSELPLNLKNED